MFCIFVRFVFVGLGVVIFGGFLLFFFFVCCFFCFVFFFFWGGNTFWGSVPTKSDSDFVNLCVGEKTL